MTILLVGIIVGSFMAMFGAGAGALTVPLAVHLLDMSYADAAIAGLAVVLVSGSVNSVIVTRRREIDFKAAVPFLVLSMPMAIVVGYLMQNAPNTLTASLLSSLLFVSSFSLMRRQRSERPGATWKGWLGALIAGSASGALGVGAGFVVVPALRLIAKLKMPIAVGTSSFILAINAIAALIGKHQVPTHEGVFLGLTSAIGVIIAGRFTQRVQPIVRQRTLAAFLFIFAATALRDALGG